MNTIHHWLVGCLLWSASCAFADEATIAVAANFTHAMKDILREFERSTDHTVRLVSGSSGKFYAQIKHGAPYHAFFSADQNAPAKLEQEGLAVPGTRFTYALGSLVLWSTQKGLVDDHGQVLRRQQFNKLAIANPRVAPYGAAAVDVLQHMGVLEQSAPRWVQGENIAQAFQFVASGNADLGFVARAQLIATNNERNGSHWRVPARYHRPIKQDAVLLRQGENNRAAKDLLEFLRSEPVRAIITHLGYDLEQQN